MFLFASAGAKRRSGELSKFQFLIPWGGVATFSLKTPQKVLVTMVCFLIYFAVLSLVFELKQNLEAQPYPKMNS